MDHIFIHCVLGHMVWCFFLSYLIISWAFPSHFYELTRGWWIRDLDELLSIIWTYFPGAICWGLWKEGNSTIFDGKSQRFEELLIQIHKYFMEWISIRGDFVDEEWIFF